MMTPTTATKPKAGLVPKIVRKAKAESSYDILKVLMQEATPIEAAAALQSIFAAGKLNAGHDDAVDALAALFFERDLLRARCAVSGVPEADRERIESVPLERLHPQVVVKLLTEATFAPAGLDALALLVVRHHAAVVDAAAPAMGEIGRVVVDAARARLGVALEPANAGRVAAYFAASQKIRFLPSESGRVVQATIADIERALAGMAPAEVWTRAYAAHYAGTGYGLTPEVLRRFDEEQLVRVCIKSAYDPFKTADLLAAFAALTPRAAPLFAALDATCVAGANPLRGIDKCIASALACLGVLACVREGVAIPDAFEKHFGATYYGTMNVTGPKGSELDLLVPLFVDALSRLAPERVVAIARAALANAERTPALLGDAVLAAAACGDAALVAEVTAKLAAAPPNAVVPSVRALLERAPQATTAAPAIAPAPAPAPAAPVSRNVAPTVAPATWTAALAAADVGVLAVPSGEIVACDGGVLEGGVTIAIAPGDYPVRVVTDAASTIRAAILTTPAATSASNVRFEYAGSYGVDAGLGAYFDRAVHRAALAHDFDDNIYDDCIAPAIDGARHAFVSLEGATFFVCLSGDGDGVYPVFVAKDDAGAVVAIVTTFD